MKKIILLTLILAYSHLLKAQTFPYLNASTGNAGEFIVDIDSNVYIYNGNIIKKLDKNFNTIWINDYNIVSFKNLLLSKNKNIYFIATNTTSSNGLIGKLNANGSLSWCKEGFLPDQMLLDRNNNLILTSPYSQGNSGGITLLVKIDTLGNLIKERHIEATGYLTANKSHIINDSAGIYTVCSWGNDFEGPVNAVLYKYSDIKDSIIQAKLIPISYMGSTGQYQVNSVGITKSKHQSDAFYITQSTSAAYQSFNCTFYLNKYKTTGKVWGVQFQTIGFPNLEGEINIEEDQLKKTYVSFSSDNVNTNKCEAWTLKIDSNGISDNKRNNLMQYYRNMQYRDTTVQLMHHFNNNYFCLIQPNSALSGPLTIIKMDSTIGSYCTPSSSISIISSSSNYFTNISTSTLTSVSSITLSPVTLTVTSVSSFSIVINSCLPLGTKEFELNHSISIFPNPTTNKLNINHSENFSIIESSIFDITGKLVAFNNYQTIIDVSKLNSGIYFIKVITDKGEFRQKFIKE